jgi:hypothetical protein
VWSRQIPVKRKLKGTVQEAQLRTAAMPVWAGTTDWCRCIILDPKQQQRNLDPNLLGLSLITAIVKPSAGFNRTLWIFFVVRTLLFSLFILF